MQMPQISRGRALAYVAALLAVLVVAGRLAFRDAEGHSAPPAVVAMRATPPSAKKFLVHVVGGVRRPGLYRLDDGSRVDDAIRMAGGPKPKAALELINLAAPVADGQQVIVPRQGKAPVAAATSAAAPTSSAAASASASGAPSAPVSLAQATPEQLDATVEGIGPVLATRIVEFRDERGNVGSIDELREVDGIGDARLEALREALIP
jgi:competence protein ComEA